MNRRDFLKGLLLSVGALATQRAIPEIPPKDEGPVNVTSDEAMKWIEEAATDIHWEVSGGGIRIQ